MADEKGGGASPEKPYKIEFTLHEILRYLWAGILTLIAWKTCDTESYHAAFKETTDAALAVAAGVGGAVIYACYRGFPAFIFDFAREVLHRLWGWIGGEESTTPRALLKRKFKVKWEHSEEAYRLVRLLPNFEPEKRAIFYKQHSEAHTIFLTATITGVAAILRGFATGSAIDDRVRLLGTISVLTGILGILYDAAISRQLYFHINTLEGVGEKLADAGFCKRPANVEKVPYEDQSAGSRRWPLRWIASLGAIVGLGWLLRFWWSL